MAIEILTKADLYEFRKSLLDDIKEILYGETNPSKKWLKSGEVRKLLNISSGTLQNLRINGTLSYTKIGNIFYYDNTDIQKLLNTNKVYAVPKMFR